MSSSFTGTLFDGETLAARLVSIQTHDGRLQSLTEGLSLDVAAADVRTSDRLASLPRFLYLPDGRTIETPDNEVIDALLAGLRRGRIVAAVDWLEARARVAAAATLLLIAAAAGTIWWGLPVLARHAAMAVPPSIEKQAGQTALLTINRLLAPTQLKRVDQARVVAQLNRLLKGHPLPIRPELVFRSMGGTYPNAFALPGGLIVVSDELVALANDEELAAVLAHEIGHWQLRHGLQGVLRSSAALLVVSTVTGDLSTLTTFAGTIPFVLLQRGYSREFEEEADAYALDLLRAAQIDAVHFATILRKLEDARPAEGQDLTYLSTHPATAERIRRIDPHGAAAAALRTAVAAATKGRATGLDVGPVPEAKPDIPARALRQPQPVYPPEMADAGVAGSVIVEFIIDANGDVRSPRIVRSSRKEFETPAIDAVMQWKFAPSRLLGRKVSTRVSQTIEFNLEDAPRGSPPAKAGALPEFRPPQPPGPASPQR